jgi:hypothetical protein
MVCLLCFVVSSSASPSCQLCLTTSFFLSHPFLLVVGCHMFHRSWAFLGAWLLLRSSALDPFLGLGPIPHRPHFLAVLLGPVPFLGSALVLRTTKPRPASFPRPQLAPVLGGAPRWCAPPRFGSSSASLRRSPSVWFLGLGLVLLLLSSPAWPRLSAPHEAFRLGSVLRMGLVWFLGLASAGFPPRFPGIALVLRTKPGAPPRPRTQTSAVLLLGPIPWPRQCSLVLFLDLGVAPVGSLPRSSASAVLPFLGVLGPRPRRCSRSSASCCWLLLVPPSVLGDPRCWAPPPLFLLLGAPHETFRAGLLLGAPHETSLFGPSALASSSVLRTKPWSSGKFLFFKCLPPIDFLSLHSLNLFSP